MTQLILLRIFVVVTLWTMSITLSPNALVYADPVNPTVCQTQIKKAGILRTSIGHLKNVVGSLMVLHGSVVLINRFTEAQPEMGSAVGHVFHAAFYSATDFGSFYYSLGEKYLGKPLADHVTEPVTRYFLEYKPRS